MAAPNLLDRIAGHPVVLATSWIALALTGYVWFTNGSASGPAVAFSVIAASWTAASRRKIIHERRWRHREAAALGYAPPRRSWFAQSLMLAVSLPLAVIAYIFLSQLARGYGIAVEDELAAWFRLARRYMASIDIRVVWVIGAVGVGLLSVAVMRRLRAASCARKTRRTVRGWTGVVEVMLPVPREE